MEQRPKDKPTPHVGSQQDGEEPELRTDLHSERKNPGLHGGSGDPAWKADKPSRKPPKTQEQE
jgi:hypothetical protein